MIRRLPLFMLILALTAVGCRFIQPTPPSDSATTAALTPQPVCTPPACRDGQTLTCPGNCPGGCGVVCADPTVVGDLSAAPTDWPGLETWLTDAWLAQTNPAVVRRALAQSGRLLDQADWTAADLDNDVRDEWIIGLSTLDSDPDHQALLMGSTGRLWIVNGRGVVYSSQTLPPIRFTRLIDLTQDGVVDLVFESTDCGANNCYTAYRVISGRGGSFRNVVQPEPATGGAVIGVIDPDSPQFFDYDGDGYNDLVIHSAPQGSVGAGIVRGATQVWRWNGDSLALAATSPDPTTWRHHILYEANSQFAAGDWAGAILNYEAVINNKALQTYAADGDEAAAYADMSLFAAFRLVLADLQMGNVAKAQQRLDWLQTNYAGRAVSVAAAQLVPAWQTTQSMEQACAAAETSLSAFDNPTGRLVDMGYANPSLSGADLCPFHQVAPDDGSALPAPWDELAAMLAQLFQTGAEPEAGRATLLQAGWLKQPADLQINDFDGDGQMEWALTLSLPEAIEYSPGSYPGDWWLVDDGRPVYTYARAVHGDADGSIAPHLINVLDLTGDALPELVLDEAQCGAHTCYSAYRILNYRDGQIRSLIQGGPPESPDSFGISYSDVLFQDQTGDDVPDMVVHGGSIGSVGAGLVRTHVEMWGWDGAAITLRSSTPDPTGYRHHLVYEANAAAQDGALERALALYQQVIEDKSLEDPYPFEGEQVEIYPALAQFSAFRLVWVNLQLERSADAERWLTWLQTTYPASLATQAATAAWQNWQATADLNQACGAAQQVLAKVEKPAGVISYLGYGNPGLDSADFCLLPN